MVQPISPNESADQNEQYAIAQVLSRGVRLQRAERILVPLDILVHEGDNCADQFRRYGQKRNIFLASKKQDTISPQTT